MKRILAQILCVFMLLSVFTGSVYADNDEELLAEVVQDDVECAMECEPIEVETEGDDEYGIDETDVEIETGVKDSGECGGNISWELLKEDILCFFVTDPSREGIMEDYSASALPPWSKYASSVVGIEIGSGLTKIGSAAFSGFTALKKVSMGKDVSAVGSGAFSLCSALTELTYAGSAAAWNAISIGEGNEPLQSASKLFGEYLAGDVNSDGKVNVLDLIALYRFRSGETSVKDDRTTDINGNGEKAEQDDLVLLMRFLAGEKVVIQ